MRERFLKGVSAIGLLYCLYEIYKLYNISKTISESDKKSDPFIYHYLFMTVAVCIVHSTLQLARLGLTPRNAYRNAYSFWYERATASQRALLDDLYERFNALGSEEQAKLVEAGLAERDGKGCIYLKFMCSILPQLICDLVILVVEDKSKEKGVTIEYHDRETIRKCFETSGNSKSPSTFRKIIAFDPKDNANDMRASYQKYIKELTNKLNELAPLQNNAHLKNA